MSTLRRATATLAAAASVTAALVGVITGAGPAHAATPGTPKSPAGLSPYYAFGPGDQLDAGGARSVLVNATLPVGPLRQVLTLPPFVLVLQTDGNLVEYLQAPGNDLTPVWSTDTTTGKRLLFQADHNVVLRDAAGRALWSTGTAGSAATSFGPYGNGEVVTQDSTGRVYSAVGRALAPSPGVLVGSGNSPSGQFTLVRQDDGNLVEYRHTAAGEKAVWSSRTAGAGVVRLVAQSDGNLVLRQASTGRAVWSAGSHGPTAYYQLDVQDDGNVVLYRTDGTRRLQAVWASGVV